MHRNYSVFLGINHTCSGSDKAATESPQRTKQHPRGPISLLTTTQPSPTSENVRKFRFLVPNKRWQLEARVVIAFALGRVLFMVIAVVAAERCTSARTNAAAVRAGLRRIACRHQLARNTAKRGFIRDEPLQLVRWPEIAVGTGIALDRLALVRIANAAQVFQADAKAMTRGHRNNLLGEAVVDVGDPPRLTTYIVIKSQSASRSRPSALTDDSSPVGH